MAYTFTNNAEDAMEIANKLVLDLGHDFIGTEHLLYGLVKEGKGVASKVLKNQNVTDEKIYEEIKNLIGLNEVKSSKEIVSVGFTPRTKRVLENSYKEARKYGFDKIGTEHLLIGIMREGDSIAVRIMLDLNLNLQRLYNELVKLSTDEEISINNTSSIVEKFGSYNATPTLNQYGTDLIKKAINNELDPVVGRVNEIERLIQILSRRSKNNPCILGEPGVGKTAIVEGLAQKIVNDDVPEMLKNKRVVNLDISSMVAGAKYRGDFEDRIKKTIAEVKKVGDVILLIDEIHTIVGAGAAEGAIDAANILKPLLARGEVQVIGATTLNEYRKYIEKDSALERRFSPVNVSEPTKEETFQILKGIKEKYETHHNIKIEDDALETAVNLSVRYITDRFLPDKAIDLIDEASSKLRMKIFTLPDKIKELEDKIQIKQNEKDNAIKNQEFEKAALIRDEENELKNKLAKEKNKWDNKNKKVEKILRKEDVENVIVNWTGIPISKLTEDENERLKKLEDSLHKRVVGQNEAVSAISKAIKRGRLGLKDPNRPIGSFLFLGPTGVGKTELTKALTEVLFGDEKSMIRVDMSEYMEGHSIAKFIGSPPGYVGFDEGGQLTEKIRRKPYSVVLFDEIEKAHPDVMNMMLQILEDGRLTDSTGRVVDFKNTVVIMTSNIGAKRITDKKTLGFVNEQDTNKNFKEYEEIKKEVMSELKKEFKPEFINRIDEIIVFRKLNNKEILEIIDIMLDQLKKRLKEQNIFIDTDEKVKNLIMTKGNDSDYGARPLRRVIQNLLENEIADLILNNKIQKNVIVKLTAIDDHVVIKK